MISTRKVDVTYSEVSLVGSVILVDGLPGKIVSVAPGTITVEVPPTHYVLNGEALTERRHEEEAEAAKKAAEEAAAEHAEQ